jgi:putative transposase
MKLRRTTRLANFSYIGRHAYLLTICCFQRHQVFTDVEFARESVVKLLRTADKFQFALNAYCLMPDHVHLLPVGEHDDSDMEAFVKSWNTQTGFSWTRRTGSKGTLWQPGYQDEILWSDASRYRAAQYVIMNPVRAGIVGDPADYEFSGSTKYSIAQLMDDGYSAVQLDDEPEAADKPKGLSPHESTGTAALRSKPRQTSSS